MVVVIIVVMMLVVMVMLLLIVVMAVMKTRPSLLRVGIVTGWPRRKTRGAKRLEPGRQKPDTPEPSLLWFVHRQHLPQPRFQHHVCRAFAAPIQPVFKILNFDDMRNLGMPDFHRGGCKAMPDVADPLVTAQRGEGLGDGFVEGLGGHVDRVLGVVQIVDNDGAGFESHDGNLTYSLFVRYWRGGVIECSYPRYCSKDAIIMLRL